MSTELAKLIYIGNQFRVKVELTAANCAKSPTAPKDVIDRALRKMQDIQDKGEIAFFNSYEDRFIKAWEAMRKPENSAITTIALTLAEGCPLLKGIDVALTQMEKAIVALSLRTNPMILRSWRAEWIVLHINRELKKLGKAEQVNAAQVQGSLLRALMGEQVKDSPINPAPASAPPEPGAKPYAIVANKARKEVILVIKSLKDLMQVYGINKMPEVVQGAANKMTEQFGGQYYVLSKEMLQAINAAVAGPEILGVDLPFVVLGAIALEGKPSEQEPAKKQAVFKLDYPGAGKLPIEVSDDGMNAVIKGFTDAIYKDSSFTPGEEWVNKELRRLNIAPRASDHCKRELLNLIVGKKDLEDVIVAQGTHPIQGKNPFVYETYKDLTAKVSEAAGADDTGEEIDLRALQQTSIVKEGQQVAEIRYDIPPQQGFDVFGNTLEPPAMGGTKVVVGEGIIEKSKGKYFAAVDGVPVIDKGNISISKMLFHKGDVNLSTGNILFDGPVEIEGSIDSGAIVDVKGDLTVKGTIRAAHVRAGGDIQVGSGIVTGTNGSVTAKGSLKAAFIENSKVLCGGSITVKKAILNSDIIAGRFIEVMDKKEGVIAGGSISTREYVNSGIVGFKNGSITKMNIGVDWRIEVSVKIRRGRMEKILEVQAKDRASLREVLSRKATQMTDKNEKRKDFYQNRLIKERTLLEKAQAHLEAAEAKLVYNPNSKIFVNSYLFPNVEIFIGGGLVPVKNEMAGVAILAKRRHGTKIVSVDIGYKLEREESSSVL